MSTENSDQKLSSYHFDLPPERIAQVPSEKRDKSKLMVLDRESGTATHSTFADLGNFLASGDLLVLNNTRVLPARIFGTRVDTGGAVEILFLRPAPEGRWTALTKSRGRLSEGENIDLQGQTVTLVERSKDGVWSIDAPDALTPHLESHGIMPLPPYIKRKREQDPETIQNDRDRYQTVFAEVPGAAAAPTAGLHFTDTLLEELRASGIRTATVTLHVGLGTFQPVRFDDIAEHSMHSEWYELPAETAQRIQETRNAGGRVIAVGTTVCRVLETVGPDLPTSGTSGETDIYIHPPYTFRGVDALITNFHTPGSSLLLLVSALAGRENILNAYRDAIDNDYRFYSYGDAMLIM
jgi:S-adenosylmethionine:tRNA ribosyltransferase-isomerase